MWPGTDFGERANEANAKWDPANIPATYFALASLLILGDDLKRVRRKDTLRWVYAMQRDDGSFGETLVEGRREGGRDPRFGYCATGIRHILRGARPPGPIDVDGESIDDIDLNKYVKCIRNSEVSRFLRRLISSIQRMLTMCPRTSTAASPTPPFTSPKQATHSAPSALSPSSLA